MASFLLVGEKVTRGGAESVTPLSAWLSIFCFFAGLDCPLASGSESRDEISALHVIDSGGVRVRAIVFQRTEAAEFQLHRIGGANPIDVALLRRGGDLFAYYPALNIITQVDDAREEAFFSLPTFLLQLETSGNNWKPLTKNLEPIDSLKGFVTVDGMVVSTRDSKEKEALIFEISEKIADSAMQLKANAVPATGEDAGKLLELRRRIDGAVLEPFSGFLDSLLLEIDLVMYAEFPIQTKIERNNHKSKEQYESEN